MATKQDCLTLQRFKLAPDENGIFTKANDLTTTKVISPIQARCKKVSCDNYLVTYFPQQ